MSTTISTPSISRFSAGNNTAPSFDAGNIEQIGDSPLLPAVGGQTQVPLIDGSWVTYANLDLAASAPALESVAARVAEVLPYYASVHRGAGYLSQVSTALYEQARAQIGAELGARDTDAVIITRNTTDSLNLLAAAVPGPVLVLDVEHHANLLPWRAVIHGVTTLPVRATIAETLAALRAELARAQDSGTPYALLTSTGASNVTGEGLPIAQLVAAAHDHGARLALDGAQLVPHRAFSLTDSGVDYVSISGHKLYAPFGAGALVGPRDWLDVAPPYLAGGGAVRLVTADQVDWTTGEARHEAGSPNVIGAVALATALTELRRARTFLPDDGAPAGLDPLTSHEAALRGQLLAGLKEIPEIRVLRIWSDSTDQVGVVAFEVAGHDHGLVAAYLAAEHGIGVRDGKFCAHPLLRELGVKGGALRASVGVSTSAGDVQRLLDGLASYLSTGPTADYAVVDGCWAVSNDPRPLVDLPGLQRISATAAPCEI